jgi:hypothetical protein
MLFAGLPSATTTRLPMTTAVTTALALVALPKIPASATAVLPVALTPLLWLLATATALIALRLIRRRLARRRLRSRFGWSGWRGGLRWFIPRTLTDHRLGRWARSRL